MDFFNGVCSVCNSGVYYVNTTSVRLVTIVKKVGGGGGGQITSLVPTHTSQCSQVPRRRVMPLPPK